MKPSKHDHFIGSKLRKVNGATPDVIACCEGINGRTAFCMVCKVSMSQFPSSVKRHLEGTSHKRKMGNAPEKESVEVLLDKHRDHLTKMTDDFQIKCHVCDDDLFKANKPYLITRHVENEKHLGILKETDEEVVSIPYSYSVNDPFLLRREKFKRQKLLKTIPSELVDTIDVKYDLLRNDYVFFCMHCKKPFANHQRAVTNHVKGPRHLKLVPDEKGRTQLEFEYDATKLFMSGKCF